jgi:hypothetical protein
MVDEKVDYKYPPAPAKPSSRVWATIRRAARRCTAAGSINLPAKPTFGDNIEFFWKYQLGWMYWRYFMWNFSGRQNGEQGFYAWDPSGNWISGLSTLSTKADRQSGTIA